MALNIFITFKNLVKFYSKNLKNHFLLIVKIHPDSLKSLRKLQIFSRNVFYFILNAQLNKDKYHFSFNLTIPINKHGKPDGENFQTQRQGDETKRGHVHTDRNVIIGRG